MAKMSKPIEVRFTHVNKTEKMRMVDEILKDRYEVAMKTREETWEAMSKKNRPTTTSGETLSSNKAYLRI